jgi:hypothetical protein
MRVGITATQQNQVSPPQHVSVSSALKRFATIVRSPRPPSGGGEVVVREHSQSARRARPSH